MTTLIIEHSNYITYVWVWVRDYGFMTDKLLVYLHKKAVFNPDVYSEFLAVMEEEETLESVVESVRSAAIQTYKPGVMGEAYSAALKAHEHTIVAGLSAGDILPNLVSAGVVSPDEDKFIRDGESSNGEQAKRLLKIIRLRGSAGFLKFKDALLDSKSQQQLGRLLFRSEESPDDKQYGLYAVRQGASTTQSGKPLWEVSLMWTKADLGGEVAKCVFSPDGTKILACELDHHKCWSQDGKLLGSVQGESQGVRVFEFFRDSTRIASVCKKEVVVWSLTSQMTELRCQGLVLSEKDSILCLNVSLDDRRLVASATNGVVMVWDTTSGACVHQSQLRGRVPCARSCCLSPDGSIAAAGFDDGSLKIWHIPSKTEIGPINTSSAYWIIDIAFSPDGTKIVTLCDRIQWWDTVGQELKKVQLNGTYGKFVKFSPDFTTFVTIDNAGMLYVLTAMQGSEE